MNKSMLSHINMQNQALWNGVVAGASLNNERALQNYAEELVSTYAHYMDEQYYLSLDELPEPEQNELVRLYMEFTDRETSECIYGNDFSIENDFTCALLSMLSNDCQKTRDELSNVMRKNIITYYSDSLQKVLDDACESGNVVWGKF